MRKRLGDGSAFSLAIRRFAADPPPLLPGTGACRASPGRRRDSRPSGARKLVGSSQLKLAGSVAIQHFVLDLVDPATFGGWIHPLRGWMDPRSAWVARLRLAGRPRVGTQASQRSAWVGYLGQA